MKMIGPKYDVDWASLDWEGLAKWQLKEMFPSVGPMTFYRKRKEYAPYTLLTHKLGAGKPTGPNQGKEKYKNVDWSLKNAQIAAQIGVTRWAVQKMRKRLFI